MRLSIAPMLALLLLADLASAATRHVAVSGDDASNDCLTAATPCRTLPHALTVFVSGDEIRMAGGTYGDPAVIGGFFQAQISGGWDEGFTTQSDATPTILQTKGQRAITANLGAPETLILSRLTIAKSGVTTPADPLDGLGGALLVVGTGGISSHLELQDVTFSGNRAVAGGAVAIMNRTLGSETTFYMNGCRFVKNKASQGGAIAIVADAAPTPFGTVENSVFEKNSAELGGGAACVLAQQFLQTKNIYFLNVQFLGNKTKSSGGAYYGSGSGGGSQSVFVNSVFLKNKAAVDGAAVAIVAAPDEADTHGQMTSFSIFNTYNKNKAPTGATFSVHALSSATGDSQATLSSFYDISYGNKKTDASLLAEASSSAQLNRNFGVHGPVDIVGAGAILSEMGNFAIEPLFVKPGKDVHLLPNSPGIDVADCNGITSDVDRDARPQGSNCDLGADEVVQP